MIFGSDPHPMSITSHIPALENQIPIDSKLGVWLYVQRVGAVVETIVLVLPSDGEGGIISAVPAGFVLHMAWFT